MGPGWVEAEGAGPEVAEVVQEGLASGRSQENG